MNGLCGSAVCSFFDAMSVIWLDFVGRVGDGAADIGSALPWFWPVTAAIVAAILASLSGVIVDRLPRMLGWHGTVDSSISLSHPGSHCDHCKRPLDVIALIPVVGWAAHRGRCQNCGHGVTPVYPILEGSSALLSLAAVSFLGATWAALAFCLCQWALLLAAWIDWREHEIPDFITVPLLFLGLAASPFDPDMASRLAGAILAGSFVLLSFRLTGTLKKVDTMSYGDVALAAACGAWLGLCGSPYLLLAASLIYIGYAVPFRARGVVWVPMGPAISAAMLLIALFGLRVA